jgi:UDP-N-acetylmuramoylalanine--D-glutamate ligase
LTTEYNGVTVSVLGLGVSNRPLIDWLLERGAIVTARDRKSREELGDAADALEARGVKLICGEGYLDNITDRVIFRSPGIRFDKPQLVEAVSRGAELISEMELFFELCPCPIFGVTGSDGKTTTTTIIYKLLQEQFGEQRVFVGGNIGAPLLPRLGEITPDCFCVVELSSFQLQTMRRSPDVAVITNISPNHLDYHLDMEEYTDAKRNIFRHQKPGSRLVLGAPCDLTRAMAAEAAPGVSVSLFGTNRASEAVTECCTQVYKRDGYIDHTLPGGEPEKLIALSDILLPGAHNADNYMAAFAAVMGFVDPSHFAPLARSFSGVEHRCQFVREYNGTRYYNSSIDSSPTRTAAALSAFDRKVIVICGGYDKHIPFDPLAESLCSHAKVAVVTGATGPKIREALLACPDYTEGNPVIISESDFDAAVEAARRAARPGDVVILSPACASFDAFPNFEARGHRFCDIVRSWK